MDVKMTNLTSTMKFDKNNDNKEIKKQNPPRSIIFQNYKKNKNLRPKNPFVFNAQNCKNSILSRSIIANSLYKKRLPTRVKDTIDNLFRRQGNLDRELGKRKNNDLLHIQKPEVTDYLY